MKRILIVTFVLAALLGVSVVQAAPMQQARSLFGWIVASRLTVNNAADLRGDVTVGDDLIVTDAATIGGTLGTTAQAAIAVGMTGYITPTGTYQPLTAAGTVGTSFVAAGAAGDVVLFINTSANTITISDTGTLKLSGNAALGQYDTLLMWSDGTNWIEVAQVDN